MSGGDPRIEAVRRRARWECWSGLALWATGCVLYAAGWSFMWLLTTLGLLLLIGGFRWRGWVSGYESALKDAPKGGEQ